jgi:hypothetical protein
VAQVNACLFQDDPMSLARAGFPTDEYLAEAESIVIRLPEARDVETMQDIVCSELERWFGSASVGPRERYTDLSRSIWQLSQRG